jgi:hypothetical protein
MNQITIPVGEPTTFAKLRELNPDASGSELAAAFTGLPDELREQAWTALRLRVALDAWGNDPESAEAKG